VSLHHLTDERLHSIVAMENEAAGGALAEYKRHIMRAAQAQTELESRRTPAYRVQSSTVKTGDVPFPG
jgi:hypothetical protein